MKEEHPLVAIDVPVYNNKNDTREFLESLKRVTYPNFKVIIIDDGSTDGTEEMIIKEFPEVLFYKTRGDLFWGKCFNIGIDIARRINAKYVLQLDNDSVVDPDFLSNLVKTAESNPKTIVTSKIYYYDDPNRIIDAGGVFKWLKGGYVLRGYDKIDNEKYNTEGEVDYGVMGFLIKTSYFEDFNGIDVENFPHWKGEVDLLLRAKKNGYRIVFQPKSLIWHKVSRTAKKGIYSSRRFLTSPLFTLKFALSQKSRGGPLSFYELMKFYRIHYPSFYIPYVMSCDIFKRLKNEYNRKR